MDQKQICSSLVQTRKMKLRKSKVEKIILTVASNFLTELGSYRALHRLSLKVSLEEDLGLGSLERVELLLRLEMELGLKFPEHLLSEVKTVEDIVGVIFEQEQEKDHSNKNNQTRKVNLLQKAKQVQDGMAGIDAWSKNGAWPETLDEALSYYAHQGRDRPHIHLRLEDGQMQVMSYGKLFAESSRVAGGLIEKWGLNPGDRVGVMLPTGPDFFYAFFGIILAGGIPVPLYPPWQANRLEEYAQRQTGILENAGVRFLVTFQRVKRLMSILKVGLPRLENVFTVESLEKCSKKTRPSIPQDISLIQYTSGSTGDPKGVVLTHANLISNIRGSAQALKITSKDIGVSWLPLYHDMGLIGAWLSCFYLGIPIVIMSPQAFLNRPERWLWAIHHYRATLSAAPNFAYELCLSRVNDKDLEGLDLSCLRAALNGAEFVSLETLERFSMKFKEYGFRIESFLPVYGLAECSLAVTIPPLNRSPLYEKVNRIIFENSGYAKLADNKEGTPLIFISTGRPLVKHDVRIVSENGEVLASRSQGQIQCRGPSAMKGYFENDTATSGVLQDKWINTGDLGYLANGELFVTGRIKDLIIKGGRNIFPQEVEQATASVKGIRRGCVAAFGVAGPELTGERLVVVAETRLSETKDQQKLILKVADCIRNRVAISPDEILLVSPHTVPKTSSGKIRRDSCRKMYLQDRLNLKTPVIWIQTSRLIMKGLIRMIWLALKKVVFWIYGGYVWLILGLVTIPCWLLLILGIPKSRPQRATVLLKFLSRLTLKLSGLQPIIKGAENFLNLSVYPEKGLLLVSNHSSYLDILILAASIPFDFCFVAKREAASWPFVGTFIKKSDYLTVDRENASEAVQDSNRIRSVLLSGRPIHIFPEGTFTAANGLRPFQMGAFKAAVDTNSPLLPVTLQGTRKVLRDGVLFPSYHRINIIVSPVIRPSGKDWKEAIRLRDRVHCEILKNSGEDALHLILAGPKKKKFKRVLGDS